MNKQTIAGASLYKKHLFAAEQSALLADIREIVRAAPLYAPVTRFGKTMSVKMSSAGQVGWYTDRKGYRYEHTHPNGQPWPDMPERVLQVWSDVTDCDRAPDTCLINFYGEGCKMGLHQDKDEVDLSYPVVSISLGDTALFKIGGRARKDPSEKILLESGDVVVLEGPSRLAYHGVDRVRFRSSGLLTEGGRINLTLRVAT